MRGAWSWQWVAVDGETAAAQMAVDERLAALGQPTLRVFRWPRPAVSIGFRQSPPSWVRSERVVAAGIEVVERPTGGGVAIHGTDLSWSVVMPAHLRGLRDVMNNTCAALAAAVEACGVRATARSYPVQSPRLLDYCLTEDSPYAIMVGSRKLGGLSARRYQISWLIQGSMLIRPLAAVFAQVMPGSVWEMFQQRTTNLEDATGRPIAHEALLSAIVEAWQTSWGIPCVRRPQDVRDDDGGMGSAVEATPAFLHDGVPTHAV